MRDKFHRGISHSFLTEIALF